MKNYTHNLKISNKIDKYIKNGDFAPAIEILQQEIKITPNDHWLYAQLSIIYYKKNEFIVALEFSQKALALDAECPMALNFHAFILFANKKIVRARKSWEKLIDKDLDNIAYGKCGEGIKYAKSIVNDARYMIAQLYLEVDDKEKALEYFKSHLRKRKRGIFSKFNKKVVEREIRKIEKLKKKPWE